MSHSMLNAITNGLANGRRATHYYQLVYELSLADPAFTLKSARANLLLSNIEADYQKIISKRFGGIDATSLAQLSMSIYVANPGDGAKTVSSGI
jgi:hypothetical protein